MLLSISVRPSLGDLWRLVSVICGWMGITHSCLSVWLFTGEPLAAEKRRLGCIGWRVVTAKDMGVH